MASTDQRPAPDVPEDSTKALLARASQQLSRLVREEMRLAQAEMVAKGRRYQIAGGLYGGAAVVGVVAFQALVAAAIALVALALPVWLSALLVAGALAAVAALLAATARKRMREGAPPRPEQAIDSVRADLAEVKERAHR
jgi:hypothetical protein